MTANLLTEWSWLLMDSLARAGIQDVVLSPGSRSTPFVFAALRQPGMRCHTIVDERSAAFFALGQARVSQRPSLLICTSGSAPGHYLPALIEARQVGAPLLVLSADRPLDLQDCSAPQTIDQVKLFGDQVLAYFELGLPDGSARALRALRRTAAQATAKAMGSLPGPVHLNARARKPLEPIEARTDDELALRALVRTLAATPLTRAWQALQLPDPEAIDALADACLQARRGLIVCGPAPLSQRESSGLIQALSARLGFPVMCETSSQLRLAGPLEQEACTIDAFDTLYRSALFRSTFIPDLVVQVGAPPTSSGWDLATAGFEQTRRMVIASSGWHDPSSDASDLVLGDVRATLQALLERLEPHPQLDLPHPAQLRWKHQLEQANSLAWRSVETVLELPPESLSEGMATRIVLNALPSDGLLMVGNSLAIRDVDTWCRAGTVAAGVLTQRGANGIDGLISGAAGAASIHTGPLLLLLGDVSFLHDVGGLAAARSASTALVIVVIHNGGGRIFEQLPVARLAGLRAGELDAWLTPQTLDLEHAARLFGLRWARASTALQLEQALQPALLTTGCTVIEARIAPEEVSRRHFGLRTHLDQALELWMDAR